MPGTATEKNEAALTTWRSLKIYHPTKSCRASKNWFLKDRHWLLSQVDENSDDQTAHQKPGFFCTLVAEAGLSDAVMVVPFEIVKI